MSGRSYVIPDDIQELVVPVLGHRMILAPGAHLQDLDERKVLSEILDRLTVPGSEAAIS